MGARFHRAVISAPLSAVFEKKSRVACEPRPQLRVLRAVLGGAPLAAPGLVLGRQRPLKRLGRVERVQRRAVVAPARIALGQQERKLERVLVLALGQRPGRPPCRSAARRRAVAAGRSPGTGRGSGRRSLRAATTAAGRRPMTRWVQRGAAVLPRSRRSPRAAAAAAPRAGTAARRRSSVVRAAPGRTASAQAGRQPLRRSSRRPHPPAVRRGRPA
jgi:hypothetical protein